MKKTLIFPGIILVLLCIFGIMAVYTSTATYAEGVYLKNQLFAYGIGFAILLILSNINPFTFQKSSLWLFFISVILLVGVLAMGTGYNETGSKSWISAGSFSFQPSELVKLCFVISFSAHITCKTTSLNRPVTVAGLILHAGIITSLICLQPDFGTAFVFWFTACVMLFCAGLKLRYFAAGISALFLSAPLLWMNLREYQKNRIMVFLNPELDRTGAGYNVIQSKTALASGGIYGQGYLDGLLTQSDLLPSKHTDFIFSVIGEETGLIGCSIILILLFLLIIFYFTTALKSSNPFSKLVCTGLGAVLLCHTVINTGMCIGIFPVTGIPLPFISYGGTFVISNMAAAGVGLSVRITSKSHLPVNSSNNNRSRRYNPNTD